MTETEWLTCTDPAKMLEAITTTDLPCGGKVSDRKLRLFACACCRQIWHLLTDERSRTAVEVSERYADGLATGHELTAAGVAAWYVAGAAEWAAGWAAEWAASKDAALAAEWAAEWAASKVSVGVEERDKQCHILSDLIGNPWRPVPGANHTGNFVCTECGCVWYSMGGVDKCPDCFSEDYHEHRDMDDWKTPTVLDLATAAYENRKGDGALDPFRLLLVADALEEAGCDNEAILDHLRSPKPHYRGCHVIDVLLGKE